MPDYDVPTTTECCFHCCCNCMCETVYVTLPTFDAVVGNVCTDSEDTVTFGGQTVCLTYSGYTIDSGICDTESNSCQFTNTNLNSPGPIVFPPPDPPPPPLPCADERTVNGFFVLPSSGDPDCVGRYVYGGLQVAAAGENGCGPGTVLLNFSVEYILPGSETLATGAIYSISCCVDIDDCGPLSTGANSCAECINNIAITRNGDFEISCEASECFGCDPPEPTECPYVPPEPLAPLREAPNPTLPRKTGPSIIRRGVNFVKAGVKHVATGRKKVSQEVQNARIALCVACTGPDGFYDPETGTCTHKKCGCGITKGVQLKTSWESSKCPIGKW